MPDQKKEEKLKKNFQHEGRFIQKLEQACGELTYISEIDAIVEPIILDDPTSAHYADYATLLRIRDTPIEEIGFDEFFDRLIVEKDWHQAADKKRAEQFLELRDLLRQELDDIRVIRAGKIRVAIYVVGIDENGRLAGVRTRAVET